MIEDRDVDVGLRFDVCVKLAVLDQTNSVTAVDRIDSKLVDE